MTQTEKQLRFLIMAGGTGGHVFPALAVADELRRRGAEVSWLGTRRGIEAEVVPQEGFPISYIKVSGLRGNGLLGWLLAPLKLTYALYQGIAVVRKFKPHAVLGMGGFVTGPGGLATWLLRKPLLIHEQNSVAGFTNRLLAPLSKKVLQAFPGAFNNVEASHTGNPVRSKIARLRANETVASKDAVKDKSDAFRLLVVGGSLGAKALNQVVPLALAAMNESDRPEVWHQAGKKNINEAQAIYDENKVTARVDAFISDMAEAYQWADIVLCRSGALTVSELAIAGVPSILVPYPHAVDDHQTGNAKYLSDADAAILVPQSKLTAAWLKQQLTGLNREKLRHMGENAKSKGLPEATILVADQCMAAAHA